MTHGMHGGQAAAGRGLGRRLRARKALLLAVVLLASVLAPAAPAGAQTVSADLALAASVAPANPHFNQLTAFEFAVTNNGPDESSNVVVSGSVPAGVQMRSLSCDGGTGSFTGSPISGFECTYATIASAETRTATVRVDADVLDAITVSAEAVADTADADLSDNAASATAHVRPADADIAVALTAPSTAAVGDTFTYRLTVFNNGPEDVKAARGTVVLPPEVSAPTSFLFPGGAGSCSMPGATICVQTVPSVRPSMKCWSPGEGGAHTVTCEVRDGGLIGPGGSGGTGQTAQMRVEALAAGEVTATATTGSSAAIDDTNAANDSSTAGTLVVDVGEVDMSITTTAPAEALVGNNFDYTLDVRNHGPITATGVTVTDTLPTGVTLVSATGSGVTCAGTDTIVCDVGALTPFQSRRITIRVTADAEGSTSNTASVTAVEPDADAANNQDSATVLIRQPAADISVVASGPSEQQVSRPFTMALTVRNDGPESTSNVRVRGALPAGLTLTSTGNFDCFSISTGFECFVGSLFANQSDSLQVRLESTEVGLLQVPITVTQAQPDPDATNNEPVYEVEIVPRPEADLAVELSLPASVEVGELFSYVLTASNAGPDAARVLVNSAFHEDAFVDEVVASPVGTCAISHGSGSLLGEQASIVACSLDSLAPGDTWTVTVTMRAVEGGSQPVTGLVNSSLFDPVGSDNSVLESFDVIDNLPPEIETVTVASQVDEGSPASASGTVTDPDGDTLTLTSSLGSVTDNGDGTWSWSYVPADGPDGPRTVTITAEDPDGEQDQTTFDLVVANVAPAVGAISAPVDPVLIGTGIDTEASFSDPGSDDTHTATWDWGDGTASDGVVDQAGGIVSGSHAYTSPGVYTVAVTVTDSDGDSAESVFEFVVVYDPDGGFVTGGGSVESPAGAYQADPSLSGKASFGFVSKYKKGASAPTGNTQFQFKAASLNFRSTSYDWLVISGATARFKGRGTINGEGDYGFMLNATDGQVKGGRGEDGFRIKIWDRLTDETVYDTDLGDAGDDALRGSIVIHGG